MASSGIYQANKQNEVLNQIAAPGFPLRWNSVTNTWYWSSNNAIPYYFFFSSVIKGSIFLLEIILLVWNQHHHGMLKTYQLYVIILEILMTCTSLTFDFVIFDDGPQLMLTCNWVYTKEDQIINPKRGGNSIYGKIGFLIAIGFGVSITLTHIAILLFLVFANLDPIYMATMCFCPDIMLNQNFTLILNLFRFLAWLQVALFSAVNLRTLFVTAMVQGFYRISLLKIMTKKGPAKNMIKLYREQLIVLNVIHSFDYKATSVGYSYICFLILAAVNGVMIGQERENPMLTAISVCMITMNLVILHFLFLLGCSFYSFSKAILRKWSQQIGMKRGPVGYLKRVLKSLPVIAMPVGDIGIVNQDMKINYLNRLLGYVVEGMMARKNR